MLHTISLALMHTVYELIYPIKLIYHCTIQTAFIKWLVNLTKY
jgi:hypothetical protein